MAVLTAVCGKRRVWFDGNIDQDLAKEEARHKQELAKLAKLKAKNFPIQVKPSRPPKRSVPPRKEAAGHAKPTTAKSAEAVSAPAPRPPEPPVVLSERDQDAPRERASYEYERAVMAAGNLSDAERALLEQNEVLKKRLADVESELAKRKSLSDELKAANEQLAEHLAREDATLRAIEAARKKDAERKVWWDLTKLKKEDK